MKTVSGTVTLESDEALAGGTAQGSKGQGTTDSPDSASADADSRKRDATLIARAALAGFELVHLADHSWLAQRWGMFRPLSTIEEVEAFLVKVGAK